MRRWLILVTIIILLFSVTAIAFAQGNPPGGTVPSIPGGTPTSAPGDEEENPQATATPIAAEEGDAPAEAGEAGEGAEAGGAAAGVPSTQAYLTVDLGGGFALDPFFVSVNGGGPVDASTFDDACMGWVSERPVVQLNWSGTAAFAEAFIYSDHNPSLVIEAPDGSFICNDNTNDMLLDPTIEVANPVTGTYNIWIGNIDNQGLIPTVLVLTSRAEVNTGTFDLTNLVQRPAIREVRLDAADAIPGLAEVQAELESALAEVAPEIVIDAETTITFTQVVSGGLPGFVFPTAVGSPFSLCNGLINPDNAHFFTLGEEVDGLNIFAESNIDGTLILVGSDGLAYCTDESPDGANRNPQLMLEDLAPGTYAIGVGNVAPNGPAEAVVTISTDMSLAPALLTPEQIGGSE